MNFNKYHVSKNVMPAGELKTVESNGVTFSSDGKGKYSMSGTATEFANVRFNLLSGFTTPISVSNGGQGTLSFFNTQSNNKVTVRFYNGTTIVDSWNLTSIRRTSTAYNALGKKYVDNVVITVSSGTTVDMTITPEFTNDGVLPSEFEPYSSEVWHNIPHYIHNTSTDTITTLPTDVYADGNNATVGISGNMSQTGTPTPQNPIQPSECGERTGNLFDYQTMLSGVAGHYLSAEGSEIINDYWAITKYIPVDGTTFTLSRTFGGGSPSVCLYDVDKHYITGVSYNNNQITTISDSRAKYARFSYFVGYEGQPAENVANDMLVKGSTAPSSYIPYGIKIPISSTNTTTPVYLGEVESTRRIKKLVLDGTENWTYRSGDPANVFFMYLPTAKTGEVAISNAYPYYSGTDFVDVNDKEFAIIRSNLAIRNSDYQYESQFKAYLAQQYAAGTPITIWYVLATPTTGIVNEPIRKIGDYADTLSNVSIPVTAGGDTLSVDTTVQPSEVTVNYKGWHPVADVHEYDSNYTIATMQTLTIAQLQTHTIGDLEGGEWS